MVVSPPAAGRDEERVSRLFQALSDPTRRDILTHALRGEHSVSALARLYPISTTAVQKHVAVLERAGLVSRRRRGREQIVSTKRAALRSAHEALDGLEAFWRERVDEMDRILEETDETEAR
jgi:DNA-binding transcriptional ArsR family regulator